MVSIASPPAVLPTSGGQGIHHWPLFLIRPARVLQSR